MTVVNAATFDIESLTLGLYDQEPDSATMQDVFDDTHRILSLLARHHVRATFFVTGIVAKLLPDLIRQIDQAGHEIGSHSFGHRCVNNMTPTQFEEDLKMSLTLIQGACGKKPRLFRAPCFSITDECRRWVFPILAEQGFVCDSSLYPMRLRRYGSSQSPLAPHSPPEARGGIWEMPISVGQIGRFRFPFAGGRYFVLTPVALLTTILRSANSRGLPGILYTHSYEFSDRPRILRQHLTVRDYVFLSYLALARLTRLRHLEYLLSRFRFSTLSESLAAYFQTHCDDLEHTLVLKP